MQNAAWHAFEDIQQAWEERVCSHMDKLEYGKQGMEWSKGIGQR